MFDTEIKKSLKLDDNHFNIPRSKSDSESFQYKPRSLNLQSFNKFPELLVLPDTDIVHDSLLSSLVNQIPHCISTNQKSPTETIEPKLNYDHYREQITVLYPTTFLSV